MIPIKWKLTRSCLRKFLTSTPKLVVQSIYHTLPGSPRCLTIAFYLCSREAQIQEFEQRRSALRELYRIWTVHDDRGYYVPQELLSQILAMKTEPNDAKELPAQITCKHRKLCPKAVVRSKRVSEVRNLPLFHSVHSLAHQVYCY